MAAESSSPSLISAAVLAAGSARRMGDEKVLLAIGGQPLLRRIVREVVALGLSEILVVANEQNEAVVLAALSDLPVHVLVNRRAAEGMGTSIALAAASVAATSRALLLLQGDQPFVDRGMLRRLIAEWESGAARQSWRRLPEFASKMGACRALCEDMKGGDYDVAVVV